MSEQGTTRDLLSRMRYLSVCSGIEAATVAWHPLGWRAHWYSEIDPFPSAVLAHHYPETPNLGDMTKFREWPDANIDLLVGGTPCQSFSVAGFRKGLADPRGNLMLTYLAIAARYRPDWLVWENVPGVLSTNEGRDFGAFVWALGKLGYGWAYRSLDAQYFNLAQQRERVFVVASARGWPSAAAVLFERASLSGHPAPSREAGEEVAGCLTSSFGSRGASGEVDGAAAGHLLPDTARCLTFHAGRYDGDTETFVAHTLRGEGFDASEDGTGRGTPLIPVAASLSAGNNANSNAAGRRREDDTNLVAQTITAEMYRSGGATAGNNSGVRNCFPMQAGVRRLTPRECERLQGFPDDYTLIPYRGRPAKDSPRYKALGNSMAVPIMRWIGERIAAVDAIVSQRAAA